MPSGGMIVTSVRSNTRPVVSSVNWKSQVGLSSISMRGLSVVRLGLTARNLRFWMFPTGSNWPYLSAACTISKLKAKLSVTVARFCPRTQTSTLPPVCRWRSVSQSRCMSGCPASTTLTWRTPGVSMAICV